MTWYGIMENCGIIECLDHCYPLSKTNLSNENDMYNPTNWINLRPKYIKDNDSKCSKIEYHLYLLQEVKPYQFIKLNAQEG